MSSFSILVVGFLLGMKHATEADHLAAVATLAAGQSSLAQTMKQGVAWGVGHTLALLLFGGLVLALGKSISAPLAQGLELAVGVMLIALGGDVLRRLRVGARTPTFTTSCGGAAYAMHRQREQARAAPHVHSRLPPLRALAVGMMHGMAGSAALILLSLQAAQSLALGWSISSSSARVHRGMALLSSRSPYQYGAPAAWNRCHPR